MPIQERRKILALIAEVLKALSFGVISGRKKLIKLVPPDARF